MNKKGLKVNQKVLLVYQKIYFQPCRKFLKKMTGYLLRMELYRIIQYWFQEFSEKTLSYCFIKANE